MSRWNWFGFSVLVGLLYSVAACSNKAPVAVAPEPADLQLDANDSIKIPEGMIEYRVKIDLLKSGAGLLLGGDEVDVGLTEHLPDGRTKSNMFLRGIQVLTVKVQLPRPDLVSLAVTPEQEKVLAAAEKRGEVKLVLRNAQNVDRKAIPALERIPVGDDDNPPAESRAPRSTATFEPLESLGGGVIGPNGPETRKVAEAINDLRMRGVGGPISSKSNAPAGAR